MGTVDPGTVKMIPGELVSGSQTALGPMMKKPDSATSRPQIYPVPKMRVCANKEAHQKAGW